MSWSAVCKILWWFCLFINLVYFFLQWDDSLGMSPEGTVKGKLHLPIPIQNADSLLNKCEAKRRKVRRWSVHEADTLRTGVKE